MIRLLIALLTGLLAGPVLAQSSVQLEHTRVELIAESARPASGGRVMLGFVMTPKPGWHTYWLNPGDAGAPTRAQWTLPAGASASELRYPTPETFIVSGLMNYVYAHENVLLADVAVPTGLTPGAPLPIAVKLDWLVCDDQLCVPEGATLRLDLAAGDGAADPAQGERFAAARAALPKPVDWPARFAFAGDRFVLAVPFAQAAKVRGAYFFPAVEGALGYTAPQSAGIAGDALRIETAAESARDLKAVPGVLKLDVDGYAEPLSFAITATPGDVPIAASPITARTEGGIGDLRTVGLALLAAVTGGLLLNIMPCVFPILSLKALSLARGGASEADARREALAYAGGVILTCLALGGLILALRAAGANVGWAFQLQDPRVIALLFLLMVAIGLNLAGLYEINLAGRGAGGALAGKGGTSGAFWTGVLAAFVATPCTGPFMGVALGAAIVLPPAIGLAVFAGLGLGLALPFLALGFVPALRRRLPKPGPWMDRFRRLLSIPMFLTALGLVWVLGRQAGVEGMTLGLGAALALGLALWWFGRRQAEGARPALVPLGVVAASMLAVLLLVSPVSQTRAAPTSDAVLAAQPFSPERLAALTAEKRPTFVYFTADWCITCKVNERAALDSATVATAFERAGVATLVGDWTKGDPVIARFLESHGRTGIPLYLFYRPDGTVEVLPQVLTVDRLTSLVA